MKYISFDFSKEYYYFIFYWILSIITSFINQKFKDLINNYENLHKKEYNLFNLIFINIGDLLSGFLVLYTYCSSKPETKEESKENKNNIESPYQLIYNDLSVKKYKYRLILLCSILHFICFGSDFIFYLIFKDENILEIDQIQWLISIEILARIVFCKFLLKIRLYKHHLLSMIISIIGFFFMGITGLIKVIDKSSDKNNRWYYLLFTFISEILISLEDVICKILLIDKFLLPQNLMFFRGIVFSVILIILIPILQSTDQIQLYDYFSFIINNVGYICLKILLIIFSFFKSFITMKVIYIFSPQHVAFLNVVFSLFDFIKYILIQNNTSIDLLIDIFDIIFLIIIILGTLIFNEMIIIKICGLDEYTKKGLLLKEKNEYKTHLTNSFTYNDERQESYFSENREDTIHTKSINSNISIVEN